MGEKNQRNHDAGQQVSQDDLQKSEITLKGQRRRADDGQGAGFGRNDGERDGPPGNIPVSQEIVFQRTLTFSELQAKQSYSRKVSRDDQVIESMKAHVLRSESVIAIRLAKMNLHYGGNHVRCGRKL